MKNPVFRLLSRAGLTALLLTSSYMAKAAAPVVDVLVLYVGAAEQARAGRDMEARVGTYIAYSNKAFANSNVDMRLRLAGIEKVNLDYTYVSEENLAALRTNGEVARLRQKYGADLVTLINLRQPMSGGYLCGIGYIPPGDGDTGRLYSNASSAAFSLVAVDCAVSTFAHELGHNMSMGHSYAQSSEGGTWSWARGHGVQGLFSTIMAYPQFYGTRTQLQQFSNPLQSGCAGQRCGVEQTAGDGADASANLNALAQQIADFMPTITSTDTGDAAVAGFPVCRKSEAEGNLIDNGEFNSLAGWSAFFQQSDLNMGQRQTQSQCLDNLLVVTNRTQLHSDAYYDLTGKLELGREYTFSARFGLVNADRDAVRVALRIEESGQVWYQYLQALSVTANDLTAYRDSFFLDAAASPDRVGLVIYGPAANTDVVIDEVVLRASESDVATTKAGAEGVVLHDRFEQVANGWGSYGDSLTSFSSHAFEGNYGLRSYSRDYDYSGPVRDVTGLLQANIQYSISADVFVHDGSASSSAVKIWIYYVDAQGEHWQEAASAAVATNMWDKITGNFSISAVGDITQARLLVGGPGPFIDLYVDNPKVHQ